MKKQILPIFALMFALVGCDNTEPIENNEEQKLTKIADHLYEYTLEDDTYFDSPQSAPANNINKKLFGCSGVNNGNYRGRNYDWYFTESDLCVVHSPKTAKRKHTSVGVADLSFAAVNDKGEYDFSKLNISKIPCVTVDGVNDAGVCIQVNVLPYGENFTEEAPNFYHTPDTSDDMPGAQVVRYILDNAGSYDEAISLLREKDIDSTYEGAEEFHWMISGPSSGVTKTGVVEFFPKANEKCMVVTEDFVDNKPIMTNFNVANFTAGYADATDKRMLNGLGMGYERWQILNENFDQGNSVMGMFDLMKKAWYSKMYDLYGDRFWYSEYNLTGISNYYADKNELKRLVDELMGEGSYDAQMAAYGDIYYNPALWGTEEPIHGDSSKTGIIAPVVDIAEGYYRSQDKTGKLWITVETSVYDLVNKTLNLSVRESHDLLKFSI